MYNTTIIGNGNLGYNFSIALEKVDGFNLYQWYGRSWNGKKLNKSSILPENPI